MSMSFVEPRTTAASQFTLISFLRNFFLRWMIEKILGKSKYRSCNLTCLYLLVAFWTFLLLFVIFFVAFCSLWYLLVACGTFWYLDPFGTFCYSLWYLFYLLVPFPTLWYLSICLSLCRLCLYLTCILLDFLVPFGSSLFKNKVQRGCSWDLI